MVEQVDKSASLYSKSIQGHDVCLLLKQMVSDSLVYPASACIKAP